MGTVSSYGSMDQAPLISPVEETGSESSHKVDVVAREALPTKNSIDLRSLSKEQRRDYALAMVCRGAKKGVLTFRDMTRSSLSMLTGVQLSGILNSQTATTVNTWFYANAQDDENSVTLSTEFPVQSPPVSLKETFNKSLKLPIDTLTYGAAVGWFLMHSATPRIERFLSTKEDAFMRRVIGNQAAEESPPVVLSTPASKASFLIEYLMPVLFDGIQNALFLRVLKNVGSMTFWPDQQPDYISKNSGDLNLLVGSEVVNTVVQLLSGDDPISNTALYLLFAAGIVMYATQAWCNFHHDLQVKQAKVEEVSGLDSDTSVGSPTSPEV
ncbi:MAG: hypothetical protein K1X28_07020 [Parachlamydiales bacterium]|nr:hypothetical protein [Parachlamydiales bacterium]